MASEDRILKILLQLQSDITGGTEMKGALGEIKDSLANIQKIDAWGNYIASAKNAKKATEDVSTSAFTLKDALKFAGAEEALRRTLDVKIGRAHV